MNEMIALHVYLFSRMSNFKIPIAKNLQKFLFVKIATPKVL